MSARDDHRGLWPALDAPGLYAAHCSCLATRTGTSAEIHNWGRTHDDSPFNRHVVSIMHGGRRVGSDGKPIDLGKADMSAVLPAPDDWNASVQHSLDNPSHILGPYTDDNGAVQMSCDGSGDPSEPSNCGFDTGRKET